MPDIDNWSEVFSTELRSVWPILQKAVRRIDGYLMGGTALAIHLKHRTSYDLDYMTTVSFSGDRLLKKFQSLTGIVEKDYSGSDELGVSINGVSIQVFRFLHQGTNPGYLKQLQPHKKIDGLPVASLPDLLASKLDLIMYRPKLRDYLDLMLIDQKSPYTLEDGIQFHMKRYGVSATSRDELRIVDLLAAPGQLDIDEKFADRKEEILDYLAVRSQNLRQHLHLLRHVETEGTPLDRPSTSLPAGLTTESEKIISQARKQQLIDKSSETSS